MVLYSMVINSPHLYAAKLLKKVLQPKENAYILMKTPAFLVKMIDFSSFIRSVRFFFFLFSMNGMPFVLYLINAPTYKLVHGYSHFLHKTSELMLNILTKATHNKDEFANFL